MMKREGLVELIEAWAVAPIKAQTAITNHTGGMRGKSISNPYSNPADTRNTAQEATAISFVFIVALRLWRDTEEETQT